MENDTITCMIVKLGLVSKAMKTVIPSFAIIT